MSKMDSDRPIYLDNNATTQLAPEVSEEMRSAFEHYFGNPSSEHKPGRQALQKLDEAREAVAQLLNCQPDELFFTSGGTESNNWALRGVWERAQAAGKDHIVTTTVEHASVREVLVFLKTRGLGVTEVKVDRKGRLDLAEVKAAITPRTFMLSFILANNETGVIFPFEALGELAKERGLLFHVDAVQAVGKLPLDLTRSTIDLLSFSGHKIHAPKGVGGLFVRRHTGINPLLYGGHQEREQRAGTENLISIIGLGKAALLAREYLAKREWQQVAQLRDQLEQAVLNQVRDAEVNGDTTRRLPNTSHISFPYLDGNALLIALDDQSIAVSAGSACAAKSVEASHVLQAMGVPHVSLYSSIRFSLSRYTTQEEIESTVSILTRIVQELHSISPFFVAEE